MKVMNLSTNTVQQLSHCSETEKCDTFFTFFLQSKSCTLKHVGNGMEALLLLWRQIFSISCLRCTFSSFINTWLDDSEYIQTNLKITGNEAIC